MGAHMRRARDSQAKYSWKGERHQVEVAVCLNLDHPPLQIHITSLSPSPSPSIDTFISLPNPKSQSQAE